MRFPSPGEAADQLRDQATSCRRLASRARTTDGSAALAIVARQFDADADRIDPGNAAVASTDCDAQSLDRVRLALNEQATRRRFRLSRSAGGRAPAATDRLSTFIKDDGQ